MDNQSTKGDGQNPIISVIIPIYNCEPYMEECAVSLFDQTLKNIEYIFIDDASDDNSITVLESVVGRYPHLSDFIRIIRHSVNKGISHLRMEGISLAKGEWIIYCDADDIVDLRAYEKMYSVACVSNADVVGCDLRYFGADIKSFISHQVEGGIDSCRLICSICGSDRKKIHGSLCNKLINKKLWENVKMPAGLSYCEDVMALLQILMLNPDVVYINDPLYHYRVRKGSLIDTKDKNMHDQCLILIPFLEELKKSCNDECKIMSAIDAKIIALLYRLVNSNADSYRAIYERYNIYKDRIDTNCQLNIFEKWHLQSILNGNFLLGESIGFCNNIGYKVIKAIKTASHKKY